MADKQKLNTEEAAVYLGIRPKQPWSSCASLRQEKTAITAKAEAQGQTVTDLSRQRALDYRLRHAADCP